MSEETYEACLTGEYNLDKEAVEYIGHLLKVGGEEAVRAAQKLWSAMPAKVLAVLALLASWGLADRIKELLKPVWGALLSAEALEVIVEMILGLALAAILLALTAAVECLPKLAD